MSENYKLVEGVFPESKIQIYSILYSGAELAVFWGGVGGEEIVKLSVFVHDTRKLVNFITFQPDL